MYELLNSALGSSGELPALLAGAAIKGFVVLAAAAGFCLLLRRASAALRHLCWSAALVSLLLIPILAAVLPSVTVGIIPAPPSSHSAAKVAEAPAVSSAVSGNEPASASQTQVVAAPASSPSPAPGGSASIWVFLVWAAVAAAVLSHLVIGIVGVMLMIRRSTPVVAATWNDLADEIADRLFIRRKVRLLMDPSVKVPMTWGLFRPVVLLPSTAENWSDDMRRCVLAHEMAHVKRLDCLTQALATVACALHWFNPLAWKAAKNMRLEREKACDDSVLTAARTKASSYAAHLLEIAQSVPDRFAAPSVAVTMATRSQLEGRVLSILDRTRNRNFRRVPAMAAISLGACATLALAAMHPVEAPPATHPTLSQADAQPAEPAVRSWSAATAEVRPATPAKEKPREFIDDVIKRSFTVSPDGWLNIDTDRGNIDVRTSSGNTVNVEVHRQVRGNASEEEFTVEFNQDGDTIDILGENVRDRNSGRDGVGVRFIVTVPRRFNLDLETAGGNIAIDDLDGTADVRTAGGNLSFGRISGSIDASTSGGNVSIDGSDGDVDVQTSGGNIRLGRVGGTVDVRTSGGNISVEEVNGDIEAVTSGGIIEARLARQPQGDCLLKTSGGSITVYLADGIAVDLVAKTSAGRVTSDVDVAVHGEIRKDRLRGTINGGGPELILDTSAGDVHIRRL